MSGLRLLIAVALIRSLSPNTPPSPVSVGGLCPRARSRRPQEVLRRMAVDWLAKPQERSAALDEVGGRLPRRAFDEPAPDEQATDEDGHKSTNSKERRRLV